MKIYNPLGDPAICDPTQVEILTDAGWSTTKPKPEVVPTAAKAAVATKVATAKASPKSGLTKGQQSAR